MKLLRIAVWNLWGLLVDDGAVAIGGLVAVVLVGLVTWLTEPLLIWGVLLFVLAWTGKAVSLNRAVQGALAQSDHGNRPPNSGSSS